ncbi:MAG: c-type cytochrome [Acidovorax sp.]|nr:MAG: c-type cytochrome [Acidovorax sp.]
MKRPAPLPPLLLASVVAALLWAAHSPGAAQSVERGRAVYAAHCSACHSVTLHGDGPAHVGVVGRRAGALKDFDYSPALRSSKILWTRATLKAWLTNPEALIPGQGMDYQLDDEREREDVVAYLATLKRVPMVGTR